MITEFQEGSHSWECLCYGQTPNNSKQALAPGSELISQRGRSPYSSRVAVKRVLDFLRATESYQLVANYPGREVREGEMGKPMRAGLCRSSTRTSSRRPGRARARRSAWRASTEPAHPLRLIWRNDEAERRRSGGEWFHTKGTAAVQDEDGYYGMSAADGT